MSISLIDIPSSVTTKCSLQCNYWFDYKDCPQVKVGTSANYFKNTLIMAIFINTWLLFLPTILKKQKTFDKEWKEWKEWKYTK